MGVVVHQHVWKYLQHRAGIQRERFGCATTSVRWCGCWVDGVVIEGVLHLVYRCVTLECVSTRRRVWIVSGRRQGACSTMRSSDL